MKVIQARNVNDALPSAVEYMAREAVARHSRCGQVLEAPVPVCTVYERPLERVLFDSVRDANPFFHFMEALWMLAGRRDVAWLTRFNPRMAEYSDDGEVFNAAYGYRWRRNFDGIDQLDEIVKILKSDPDSRRAVLQIWDAADLGKDSKDLACNTQAYFKVRDGTLNMTVCNRSNDLVWGCYGANVVHFSVLMEYMAARIGVRVGTYRQVSDSLHAYVDTWGKVSGVTPTPFEPYVTHEVSPYPLVQDAEAFDLDLQWWVNGGRPTGGFRNPFFQDVADPLLIAWHAYKRRDFEVALEHVSECAASDWRAACEQWLLRRAPASSPEVANPAEPRYLQRLPGVLSDDLDALRRAQESYGDSWRRRGGVGAYMMLARKWDRIEKQVDASGWDVFGAAAADTRPEGVIDDIRDLRRYLALVEAEILVRREASK